LHGLDLARYIFLAEKDVRVCGVPTSIFDCHPSGESRIPFRENKTLSFSVEFLIMDECGNQGRNA